MTQFSRRSFLKSSALGASGVAGVAALIASPEAPAAETPATGGRGPVTEAPGVNQ